MNIKKNDVFEVIIEDMSESGEGVGKLDGYIWFIKDAVIGDLIEAKAMKMKKNYGFARLMKVLKPSPARVKERCAVARQCGGCQLQMMSYEEQLKFKQRKVYNNLKRIGGLDNLYLPGEGPGAGEKDGEGDRAGDREGGESGRKPVIMEPIIGMEDPWRYRNKAQFPFGMNKENEVIAGFYAGRTHCIIENDDCLLGIQENREILAAVKQIMTQYGIKPYQEESHTGLIRHVLIRKGFRTGELMVCFVVNGRKLPYSEGFVERLLEIPGMTSISYNVNMEKTNVILGREVVNLYGPGYITDYIGNVKYRISPLSFYQVNPVQTERLYGTALEYAGLTGEETVWDLYCGIGTISLFLSQKAKKVYGVEIVPQAIEDARENARLNGIENVEFFVGKAEEVLPKQYEEDKVYADVIVVDPPRKGCDPVCLDTIVMMGPKKVVYVSCDSATLARDVKYLEERGYWVERVSCVDMFPMSGHVETVVLLSKGEIDSKKVRVEFSLEDMDMSGFQKGATYEQIKAYVLEHTGLKVSSLYISQIKRKCGLDVGQNYNLSKKEDAKVPKCPPEKEAAIRDALKYFQMI